MARHARGVDGRLFVSSDESGIIIAVGYNGDYNGDYNGG